MGENNNKPPKFSLQITLLFVNLAITVGIGLLVALLPDETSIGVRLAVLAVNFVALFSVLQFFIAQKFTESKKQIDELQKKIENIEKCVSINEVYKKIQTLEPVERDFYWNHIKTVEGKLNTWINERRSGGLTRYDYYTQLDNAAKKIKSDYAKLKDKSKYTGEIWAMSFWQDDEWNRQSNDYEDAWIKELEVMDKLGIKTARVAIMVNKKTLLRQRNIDESVKNLINKIVDNCHATRVRQNTTTFFVDDIDDKVKEVVGKGFFAIKLHKKEELSLIRGVSLDKLEGATLEGELVFSKEEVLKIRKAWIDCQTIGKSPEEYFSGQYYSGNISEEVKEEMVKRGLNWFADRTTA